MKNICKRHNMEDAWPYRCPCFYNHPSFIAGERGYDETYTFESSKTILYTPDETHPLQKRTRKEREEFLKIIP